MTAKELIEHTPARGPRSRRCSWDGVVGAGVHRVMPVPWPEPGQVAAEVSAYATALVGTAGTRPRDDATAANPAPTWPAPYVIAA